jgi:HPt (histidine-containing phosphotransfer) domain-containing protein
MSANQEGSDFELLIELFEGNEESLKEVISIFLKDLPISILKIKSDCKNGDWTAAKGVAHQMKPFYGYSGNQKAISLLEQFQLELESASAPYDYTSLLDQIEAITEDMIKKLGDRFRV